MKLELRVILDLLSSNQIFFLRKILEITRREKACVARDDIGVDRCRFLGVIELPIDIVFEIVDLLNDMVLHRVLVVRVHRQVNVVVRSKIANGLVVLVFSSVIVIVLIAN